MFYIFTFIYLFIFIGNGMWTCMMVFPPLLYTFIFWDTMSHWTWSSSDWLDYCQLASGSFLFLTPWCWSYTSVPSHWPFTWALGSWTQNFQVWVSQSLPIEPSHLLHVCLNEIENKSYFKIWKVPRQWQQFSMSVSIWYNNICYRILDVWE